jgi:uncharacterized protein
MRFVIALLAGLAFSASESSARCAGQDLMTTLPEAEVQALRARAEAGAYPVGNFWRATKDGQEIHLIGTYHIEDARNDATLALLMPVLDKAAIVLVEAGPAEISALKELMARKPDLMINDDGPSLRDSLSPALWDRFSAAMTERGVPLAIAGKMRPWFLSLMLSMPPCALENMGKERGLDTMVIEAAGARDLPIRALEPFDTVFRLFDTLPAEDQVSMVTASLALQDRSEDMSATLADAYFREEGRLIWEFSRDLTAQLPGYTPERVEAEFATMEAALMTNRNRDWMPVLLEAAKKGPALAAFGALHLSGDQGVLALLAAEGFAIERLAFR